MFPLLDDFVRGLREALKSNPILSGGFYLGVVGIVLTLVRRIPSALMRWIQRRIVLTVEMDSSDPGFQWLQVWLSQQRNSLRARHLIVRTRNLQPEFGELPSESTGEVSLMLPRFEMLFTPAPGMYLMRYRGHYLLLGLSRERRHTNELFSGYHETLIIRALGARLQLVEHLIADARRVAVRDDERRIAIRVPRMGFWNAIDTQLPRPLDSLVMDGQIATQIIEDIQRFVRERLWYLQMGIPWRRSFLLYGEPGNGKTSLVKAVAGFLNLDIAALSLSGSDFNDEMLLGLVTSLPERNLLLLEDIDAVFVGRNRIDESSKVTFTGLLNALDGVASRDGLIVFMTTNHRERLDSALIRPGRADVHVYIGNATRSQVMLMVNRFFPESQNTAWGELFEIWPERQFSMAWVQEHLMRHRNNETLALEEILAMVVVQISQDGMNVQLTHAH